MSTRDIVRSIEAMFPKGIEENYVKLISDNKTTVDMVNEIEELNLHGKHSILDGLYSYRKDIINAYYEGLLNEKEFDREINRLNWYKRKLARYIKLHGEPKYSFNEYLKLNSYIL